MSIKKIIHIDMDYFYAQVEIRDNPSLNGKPVAVGYDGPRSVVSTANYIARRMGVHSAMSIAHAKILCPELIIVNSRMDVYREISAHIRTIFEDYTDKIQPLSLDEAFLDLTDCLLCKGSATLIAQEIRQRIYDDLNLTASAGIAPNKFLAKIASDENKPNGQYLISPEHVFSFVDKLPLRKIPGIGPKTSARYKEFDLETCEDVRNCSPKLLKFVAGNFTETLLELSHGIDNREVNPNRERKSVSVETTFESDLVSISECTDSIQTLMPRLIERLEKFKDKNIVKQGVKLKFSDFTQTTVECRSNMTSFPVFINLMRKAFLKKGNLNIRLIGITIGFAPDSEKKQIKQYTLDV